jgi:isopenicillin-N N-acyltransferase-like protein
MTPSITPFPFVSVAGTPYERGRQHGRAVAARVRRSAALYNGTLGTLGFGGARGTELIAKFAQQIEAFGAHYVDEMHGIADGADIPFEQAVMINARTEVIAEARRLSAADVQAAAALAPKDGCTGAVILPARSRSGRLIHGQNWDWRAECAETAIVLRVRRADGPDFITFVEAGGLARSGFNAAGIAITANYLRCDRDYLQTGVPLALIRRKVLEQEHFALAIRAVATTPKACSNNMMLSHADGVAIDLECAPDESFPLFPEGGLLVHANHFVNSAALAKLRDTGILASPDSYYRDLRVREALQARSDGLTTDDLKAAFFDEFGKPYSVCRPPRPGVQDDDLTATVAMILMEPAAGQIDVAPLPALNRVFTRYSLAGEPQTLAAADRDVPREMP